MQGKGVRILHLSEIKFLERLIENCWLIISKDGKMS